MSLRNTRTAYGWIAIALHWIGAAAMIALWWTGENLEHAVGRPARLAALTQHISVGMLLFALLAARVIWTLTQPKPEPLETRKLFEVAAKVVQWAFLAVVAVLILTGPLAIWTVGRPVPVFDWFEIPSFMGRNHMAHEATEGAHKLVAELFLPLLAIHVLGALKHVVFDRDATLQRMLWVRRRNA